MEYILDIFYEFIYEPIYYTFEKYFHTEPIYNDFLFIKNDISDEEINKLLNDTISEINREKQIKELEMCYIELTKDDNADNCLRIDDDRDDDDNENALLNRIRIPISF